MNSDDHWTRGELADRAGVHPETLRYYEEEGLIPDPRRSGAGYRLYGSHYLPRLRFIQRAKNLGFTLREIRELLELRVGEESDCGDVRRMGEEKLADIEQKISDLKRFRSALLTLIDRCDGEGPTGSCPILEVLETKDLFEEVVPKSDSPPDHPANRSGDS